MKNRQSLFGNYVEQKPKFFKWIKQFIIWIKEFFTEGYYISIWQWWGWGFCILQVITALLFLCLICVIALIVYLKATGMLK